MKCLMYTLLMLLSFSPLAGQLDLRLFQYPVEDAKKSAKNPVPRFCTFIVSDKGKPRLPGVRPEKARMVLAKHRTKVMNEYRLYEKGEMDLQEKMLLERYCTRYNRILMSELGL